VRERERERELVGERFLSFVLVLRANIGERKRWSGKKKSLVIFLVCFAFFFSFLKTLEEEEKERPTSPLLKIRVPEQEKQNKTKNIDKEQVT
jgi:hypothetical protein